jgi:hypothetical protein
VRHRGDIRARIAIRRSRILDVGEDVRQLRQTRLRLVALALAVGLLAACTGATGLDEATASRTAIDYFASAHGSGTTVSNVRIDSIELGADAGHSAWKVNISGDVSEAGHTSTAYTSHEWLYVYVDTGEVRVFAQG